MTGFSRVAVPEAWTILGLRLLPFSIGHWIILDALESPFSPSDPSPATEQELVAAVWACSNTYESAVSWFNSPWLPFRLWLWRKQRGRCDMQAKASMFRDYITAAVSGLPEAWGEDGKEHQRARGIPFPQSLKVSMMSNMGMSASQALNYPVAMAVWDHVTLRAQKEDLEIVTDEERELWKLANPWSRQ